MIIISFACLSVRRFSVWSLGKFSSTCGMTPMLFVTLSIVRDQDLQTNRLEAVMVSLKALNALNNSKYLVD